MKISVIQSDLVWENRSGNLKKLENLLSSLFNKTDLVVLPEMFNTGFSMKADFLSEPTSGDTYHWMKEISGFGNFGICGSYLVSVMGKIYNRWVFAGPENENWHYDKRHLFSMSGEDKYITPGNERLIFNFRGVRISPYICYDLRFPVWSRNNNDYDLSIYAANWPESRKNVWNTLLKARAIENQCYVAGANRIGTDGNGIKYCGDSMILDSHGEVIAMAGPDQEHCISTEISMAELSDFRNKFPVLDDADRFVIN